MVLSFGVGESEAMSRVVHFAKGVKTTSAYLILHRSVSYWAEGIYYKFNEEGGLTKEPKPLPVER